MTEMDDEEKMRPEEDLRKSMEELSLKYAETIRIWALALGLRDQDTDEDFGRV